MLPLSELIDVCANLDRNSLDVLQLTNKYLRQVVDDRLANVCLRPIEVARLECETLKVVTSVRMSRYGNAEATHENFKTAARWLSRALRHSVVNLFKLQMVVLPVHIPLFRFLEPENFTLRCVTFESCAFTRLTPDQLQTLVTDLLPSRDYNFSACSLQGGQLSDQLIERWVENDVRRVRFDSEMEVLESDMAVTDAGIITWLCGTKILSEGSGDATGKTRLLVLYKVRLPRTFIDKLAQTFLNATTPRSSTAHIEGRCRQNVEKFAAQLKSARGVIGEVQFVNDATNEILCVLLCSKRRIEIERRQLR